MTVAANGLSYLSFFLLIDVCVCVCIFFFVLFHVMYANVMMNGFGTRYAGAVFTQPYNRPTAIDVWRGFQLYLQLYSQLKSCCMTLCTVNCTTTIMYNAALDRPAYMSNVDRDFRGVYSASLANDGNLETNAVKNNKSTCAASFIENYPWWAVDLGRAITVHKVDFTSRGDCCGKNRFQAYRPIVLPKCTVGGP